MVSYQKKKKRAIGKPASVQPQQRFFIKWAFLSVIFVAGAAGLVFYLFQATDAEKRPISVTDQPSSGAKVEFEKLIGRWLRPDGGYVIEIRNIRSSGQIEAAYFNPRPINVSRAKASLKNEILEIFLELLDTGYQGSTYTLIYNPEQDLLHGIYYQATLGQSFEVLFVRMK
jgi:hypothetical protein